MHSVMTEEKTMQLLKAAMTGNRAAFDGLIHLYRESLTAILRPRIRPQIRDHLNLDDLVHETFARAFESLDRFRGTGPSDFLGWLVGIGKKVVLKAIEQLQRQPRLSLDDEQPASGTSPSRRARRVERLERLEYALRSLSDDHRKVIHLCRLEGLSLAEAADRMGRSSDAIRKLLWRALRELRRTFGDTESLHLGSQSLGNEGSSCEV